MSRRRNGYWVRPRWKVNTGFAGLVYYQDLKQVIANRPKADRASG